MAFERSAGILLHPSSLPGPYGIGELGSEVERWLDFLARAGIRLWQIMPLGPTGYGDSPYQCFSAFAGNPYLISVERLLAEGLLDSEDVSDMPSFSDDFVDFGALIPWKLQVLSRSHQIFLERASQGQREGFARFCAAQDWLDDYALFMAIKEAHGGSPWTAWPQDLRTRDAQALARAREDYAQAIDKQRYWQWLFFRQWEQVKACAQQNEIRIVGDIPIFVAFDSADTWANPELFYLEDDGQPSVVAGVPPDYFSETGQRWGNPLYRWDVMARDDYAWWRKRFRETLATVDIVRVDHFRGFEAYWEIPASEPTAVKGRWCQGPGQVLFDSLRREFSDDLPIIAEDLGIITKEVEALRDDNRLPGMKVLQFAFASNASDPYLPHNYHKHSVVYTATHDNDTTVSWFATISEEERDGVRRYLARDGQDIAWDLIRLAFASIAVMAIAPLQDVLRLDRSARMNTPGQAAGNWCWRCSKEALEDDLAGHLRDMVGLYGRGQSSCVYDSPYRQSDLSH